MSRTDGVNSMHQNAIRRATEFIHTLSTDGQPLAGEQQSPSVPAHGEAIVEFDHALRGEGTHVLSVAAEMPIATLERSLIPESRSKQDKQEESNVSPADAFATFTAPDGATFEIQIAANPSQTVEPQTGNQTGLAVFRDTFVPGVYAMATKADAGRTEEADRFVVNYDHSEDSLAQLTAD